MSIGSRLLMVLVYGLIVVNLSAALPLFVMVLVLGIIGKSPAGFL